MISLSALHPLPKKGRQDNIYDMRLTQHRHRLFRGCREGDGEHGENQKQTFENMSVSLAQDMTWNPWNSLMSLPNCAHMKQLS